MEEFFETNSQYRSGFVLQEYRDRWSLVCARQYETRDGETKTALRFGEIEIGKDRSARLPVAVELGSTKQEAIETLRAVLMHLEKQTPGKPVREAYASRDDRPLPDDDDIPF